MKIAVITTLILAIISTLGSILLLNYYSIDRNNFIIQRPISEMNLDLISQTSLNRLELNLCNTEVRFVPVATQTADLKIEGKIYYEGDVAENWAAMTEDLTGYKLSTCLENRSQEFMINFGWSERQNQPRNQLTISLPADKNWEEFKVEAREYNLLKGEIGAQKISFNSRTGELYLPELKMTFSGDNSELNLENGLGRAVMGQISQVEKVTLQSRSGSINVGSLQAEQAEINNDLGETKVEIASVSGTLTATNHSGRLEVKKGLASDLTLINDLGEINWSGEMEAKEITSVSLENDMGEINMENVAATKFTVDNRVGSVKIKSCRGQFSVENDSGDVEFNNVKFETGSRANRNNVGEITVKNSEGELVQAI